MHIYIYGSVAQLSWEILTALNSPRVWTAQNSCGQECSYFGGLHSSPTPKFGICREVRYLECRVLQSQAVHACLTPSVSQRCLWAWCHLCF